MTSTTYEYRVRCGLPPVDETLELLKKAYGSWGDESLFHWKYDYPGTSRDEHHQYIKEEGQLTAFARLYHRSLISFGETSRVVVRGNAAVHPSYQGEGRYSELHRATKRHCDRYDMDTIFTFNRKDNVSFRTDLKASWSYIELPLYIRILSYPTTVVEYSDSVLSQKSYLKRSVRALDRLFDLSVGGQPIRLAELAGEPSNADTPPLTIYLSEPAIDEIVAVVVDESRYSDAVRCGARLLAHGHASLFNSVVDGAATSSPHTDQTIPHSVQTRQPREITDQEMAELHDLYHDINDGYDIYFRRSSDDIAHLLSHPDTVSTYWVKRDSTLAGFASVCTVENELTTEGRILDVLARDEDTRTDLYTAIEEDARANDVDIIAGFSSRPPGDRWIRIPRHVLMWETGDKGLDERLRKGDWRLGFYDVV